MLSIGHSPNTHDGQALAYLFHQSPYVFPIVGVQRIAHVRAMNDALAINLTEEDISAIHEAAPFNPLFPMNFLYPYKDGKGYSLQLTAADNVQYQMAAWINVPGKPPVSQEW